MGRSAAIAAAGPAGFDLTAHVAQVAEDMIVRLPELAHIDVRRVAFSFSRARNRSQYGLYASLTPLRFRDGALTTKRRGRTYTIQRLHAPDGREQLYILTICLPRFMDLCFREKLITVLHELWHISPRFDGDLRRHSGRCYAHTHSQAEYDQAMGELADRWLAMRPPEDLLRSFRRTFAQLHQEHGCIVGVRIPRPRLIPAAFTPSG